MHIKDDGLRKKEARGFAFGLGSSLEKKKIGGRVTGERRT